MAIDQVRTSFVEAELKGDRAAQASLYTSDAVLLEPDAPVFQGRRAIRAGLEEINVVLAGFTLKSLELGGGNSTAYDRGVYRLQYFDSAAGAMAAERGNYLMILRRQREGSWRIVALIHNPLERSLEPGKPSSR
jgi:ketosteroid isomerase-like protein